MPARNVAEDRRCIECDRDFRDEAFVRQRSLQECKKLVGVAGGGIEREKESLAGVERGDQVAKPGVLPLRLEVSEVAIKCRQTFEERVDLVAMLLDPPRRAISGFAHHAKQLIDPVLVCGPPLGRSLSEQL